MIIIDVNRDKFAKAQLENERRLKKFFDFLNLFVCKRCWSRKVEADNPQKPYHHHGALYQMMSRSDKIPYNLLEKWKIETEHGYFHGIMVLYFAWFFGDQSDTHVCQKGHQIDESEVMVPSCLFHDFVKVCGGTDSGHDVALRKWFNFLSEDTYTHSHPDQETLLVMGDRMELLRFKDWRQWVKPQVLKRQFDLYGTIEVNHFFRHVRPVMERMFRCSDEVWIAHVLESSDNLGVRHYPKAHWKACDEGYSEYVDSQTHKLFSVNTGKLPCESVGSCVGHTASNGYPRGLISFSDLLRSGCDLVAPPLSTWGRDHPFVVENKKIPIENWVFIYEDLEELEKLDLRNCAVMSRSLFNYIFYVMENLFGKIQIMTLDRKSFLSRSM